MPITFRSSPAPGRRARAHRLLPILADPRCAPYTARTFATLKWRAERASASGVLREASSVFTSQRVARRSLTMSTCPALAATCSAVRPSKSFLATTLDAPWTMRFTLSTSPCTHAKHSRTWSSSCRFDLVDAMTDWSLESEVDPCAPSAMPPFAAEPPNSLSSWLKREALRISNVALLSGALLSEWTPRLFLRALPNAPDLAAVAVGPSSNCLRAVDMTMSSWSGCSLRASW
mmetsp:Transcript_17523/g.50896  ORF Transcript_17523/g.50896 Transcript_17523/m.50896 type:complete len:232 (-) Transcript_17523:2825-3520(-)